MNPEECARLLAIAGTYDNRLTPPSKADAQARAVGWSKALDAAMPFEFAVDAIIHHYANQIVGLMPAHLNLEWRQHRKAEAERNANARILEDRQGIPMPDYVREEFNRIMRGTHP
jgi:hypothetical protein